jgi:hypothetical protein
VRPFWDGFYKRAEALDAGGGFTGVGKGVLVGQLTYSGPLSGNVSQSGPSEDSVKTDHTLLDRERNPRDFGIGDSGPEFQAESNPHIRY